ncbi:ORF6N domain-containing protein [Thiomicrospira microaerophila]|uniref:ORF6N domain-containing protein n=1 Tax=Thiomicrospira microaerophila TaxID=406020 RepID=UPI0009FDB3CD|nr:ORF6N domain-containing protein [Thiomicrospira microaerophila]
MNSLELLDENTNKSKIYTLRNVQVMLDRDLADLYGVETKRLNEQVKRNIARFPETFRFQLSKQEFENWKSQIATSNNEKMGLRRAPYAFTEQGAILSQQQLAICAGFAIINKPTLSMSSDIGGLFLCLI